MAIFFKSPEIEIITVEESPPTPTRTLAYSAIPLYRAIPRGKVKNVKRLKLPKFQWDRFLASILFILVLTILSIYTREYSIKFSEFLLGVCKLLIGATLGMLIGEKLFLKSLIKFMSLYLDEIEKKGDNK